MARHGDSCGHLVRAIVRLKEKFDRKTFYCWAAGAKLPGTVQSFEMLARVEHRYRLPAGYFRSKLTNSGRALVGVGRRLTDVSASERRRLAWHLPDDFDKRPKAERDDILEWIRTVIVSGSTEYRRFQAEALKVRYALRFPDFSLGGTHVDGPLAAPQPLVKEMGNLIRFKTATLTQIGFKRSGVWGEETVSQKIEHFGLLFGALSGDPQSPVAGYGVPTDSLTMALLIFPAVWDWYLQWREARRGFYTNWEVNMLALNAAFSRRETGWLRQNVWIADALLPVPGLVSIDDIALARQDWNAACDRAHDHALARSKEIARVARVHRDPFEPMRDELQPADRSGYILVGGSWHIRTYDRVENVSCSSALVEPALAASLLRAVQTMDSAWDYGIPREGEEYDLDPDKGPYEMTPWLRTPNSDGGVDDLDPLRGNASLVTWMPGRRVREACGLQRGPAGSPYWWAPDRPPMFRFEVWGEHDRDDDRYRTTMAVAGHRLLVEKVQLLEFLGREGRELVIEVEVRREGRENRRSYDPEDSTPDSPYDRLYRLDAGGELHTAEGRVGTWTSDRPAA